MFFDRRLWHSASTNYWKESRRVLFYGYPSPLPKMSPSKPGSKNTGSAVNSKKKGVMGVYHKVSRKHLPHYITEFVARQNMRVKDTIDQMKMIVQRFEGKWLRYYDLIG